MEMGFKKWLIQENLGLFSKHMCFSHCNLNILAIRFVARSILITNCEIDLVEQHAIRLLMNSNVHNYEGSSIATIFGVIL
jgi:hypothetical protein